MPSKHQRVLVGFEVTSSMDQPVVGLQEALASW